MNSRTRRRQTLAARLVFLVTLSIIVFMPKIELDVFDAPTVMSFTTAQPFAAE